MMTTPQNTGYSDLGTLGIEKFGRRLGVALLEATHEPAPVVVFGPSALARVGGAEYLWWQANAETEVIEGLRPLMARGSPASERLVEAAPQLQLHSVALGHRSMLVSCFLPRRDKYRVIWEHLNEGAWMSTWKQELLQFMNTERRRTREIRSQSLLDDVDHDPHPPVSPPLGGRSAQPSQPRVHSSPPSSSSFEAAER